MESVIPNPESTTCVFKDEIVNFYVTFKGQLSQPAVFNFSYEDSLNKQSFESELVVDPSAESASFIDRMGHFKKVRLLEDSYHSNENLEDMMYFVKSMDRKALVI